MTRNVPALFALGGLLLTGAACASSDADDSFGVGQPSTTIDATTSTINPTSPSTTDEPAATATAPPPAETTSTTAPGPLPEPVVSLYEFATFDQPVDVVDRPGDGTVYVVEQPGRVVAATDLSTETVLDITDLTEAQGEQGLLGLAFHPTEDLAYVHYTDLMGDTVIAEFCAGSGHRPLRSGLVA